MPASLRYCNPRQVIAAIVEADGHRARPHACWTCPKIPMSNYKKRWPEVAEACAMQGKTDVRAGSRSRCTKRRWARKAGRTIRHVRQPDHTAAIFVMKTQGGLV